MDQPTAEPAEPGHVPDTGDLIDPTAHDPLHEPVTDPDDPSYVEPDPAAVRVDPDLLLPAGGDDPERDPEGHA